MNTELKKAPDSPVQSVSPSWKRPSYNVVEHDEAYTIRVTLPGVAREGVEIALDDDVLTIKATASDRVPETWRPLHRERRPGNYRLDLRLDGQVDGASIKARVADGVLELNLPKAEAAKPRKIEVT